jgi:probable rRNA maturation factor
MPISVRTPPELRRLAPALRTLVRIALAAERRTAGEIGVVLADDATLRSLNRQWRSLDRATDVLSFVYEPIEEPATSRATLGRPGRRRSAASRPRSAARPPVSGDLVVSTDRVRAQARRFRVSEAHELARLVIHGALHLAGLDHARPAERRAMRSREDAALRAGAAAVRALARAGSGTRDRRRARARGARAAARARRHA